MPCVGGLDLGQLVIEVTPEKLRNVIAAVLKAHSETRVRYNPNTERDEPNPSPARSETGAIERVELYAASDRRKFDLDQAMVWLSSAGTGQNYEVELFKRPEPGYNMAAPSFGEQLLFTSFYQGLVRLGAGVNVWRLQETPSARAAMIGVRLEAHEGPSTVRLLPGPRPPGDVTVRFDPSRERHRELITFLERHPLVKAIRLPGRIVRSAPPVRTRPGTVNIPVRDKARAYPKIGLIDGGISAATGDWLIGRWSVLDDGDVDEEHGTFIAGLLIAGSELNGADVLDETDGVDVYDARVFPVETSFDTYYLDLESFFEEIENTIISARQQYGVRVFNMSINVTIPVASDHYSRWAAKIDQIADDHDVVIFVSAGNLEDAPRPEWPSKHEHALAMLAASTDDLILTPAESARNASVGAVNPPGCGSAIAYAPARYTRRGPGLKSLVKPDFAHVGGNGSPGGPLGHGLFSIDPAGGVADGCGTSYATPLVAKTAACLESLVEGEMSRETMLALLAHHSNHPECLHPKVFGPVSRQLVGHGIPCGATSMLEGGDHEITLVFSSHLPKDKKLVFPFLWPPSLTKSGNCRGEATLTLFSSPPLDARFGAEFVRINIDAALQQEKENGGWRGRIKPRYLPTSSSLYPIEAERIEQGYKWNPMKLFHSRFKGVGKSANWRLVIEYVTRAGQVMPDNGVPFTAILTIRDQAGDAPVFSELRQYLAAQAIAIQDIRTAARVLIRV